MSWFIAELVKTVIFVLNFRLMKKLLLLLVLTSVACSDGDFTAPGFEFDETISSCGNYTLYKTNTKKTEVLVLTIPESYLGTAEQEKTYPISATAIVTYRVFDNGIGNDYFCQPLPPTSPKVIKNIKANSGNITIITTEILKDGVVTGFNYDISLTELLFDDGKERIFYETYHFGIFTKES